MVVTQPREFISELAATAFFAIKLAIVGAAGGICFWFSAGSDFRHPQPKS